MSDPKSPNFKLSRVLFVVVPLALFLVGGFIVLTQFDGIEVIEAWMRPARVVVTGIVTMDGKPLRGAQILTKPANSRLKGSIGVSEEDGSFELLLDVGGRYEEGAYVGEHKVTVAAYGPNPPASPPPMISPAIYASFSTTPLVYHVSTDAAGNEWRIDIHGQEQ